MSDGSTDWPAWPIVRRWFTDAGLDELSFDGQPESYGVGINRRSAVGRPHPLPERLFEFVR